MKGISAITMKSFLRRVGPLVDPGEKRADNERQKAGAESVFYRVPKQQIKFAVEVSLDIILDGVGGARLPDGRAPDAAVKQHDERNAREIEHEQRATQQDHCLGVNEPSH